MCFLSRGNFVSNLSILQAIDGNIQDSIIMAAKKNTNPGMMGKNAPRIDKVRKIHIATIRMIFFNMTTSFIKLN